jgi:hypothetical protein
MIETVGRSGKELLRVLRKRAIETNFPTKRRDYSIQNRVSVVIHETVRILGTDVELWRYYYYYYY